jgi:hypothetical protein
MTDIISTEVLLYWTDLLLFLLFAIPVGYALVFALASLRKMGRQFNDTKKLYRYCILIPVPKGLDGNLVASVQSIRRMAFSKDHYDIVISSNGLSADIKNELEALQVVLLEKPNVHANPNALIAVALASIKTTTYDVLVLLNANNQVDSHYLADINKAYHTGGMAIQTHKVSNHHPTQLSWLNAMMDEINNSIFRRGHVNMGFSSSLMGTGMAFDMQWFTSHVNLSDRIDLTKHIEAKLLKQGLFIEYLEHVHTYEDSPADVAAYNQLRKEWSSSVVHTKKRIFKDLPRAIFAGNLDYCDKILQWIMPSKILLVGFLFIIAGMLAYYEPTLSVKWWIMTGTLLFSYILAIPDKMLTTRGILSIILLPVLFISVIFSKLFTRSKR